MKKYLFFLLLIIAGTPQNTFAYDPETTHAGLTEQVVEFYNLNSNTILNSDDKESIILGAVEEDEPAVRALNHFYDPLRLIGINNNRTSYVWATEPNNGNDFTWSANIEKYAKGDRTGALVGLGHILHLIEDLTVPDHTRNDPHIGEGIGGAYTGGSPYETWCKENKDREALAGTALYYKSLGLKPRRAGSVKNYFGNIAAYSNNNYVSQDSIENSVYQYVNPKVVAKRNGYAYGDDSYFYDRHKLYIDYLTKEGNIFKSLVDTDTRDFSVLEEYFTRLSKMAILSGAGVVEIFFTEAEYARTKYLEAERIKQEAIAEDQAEKEARLTEGGFMSRIWYGINYAVTGAVQTIANGIANTATLFASSLYNGGSFALNTTRNTINSLGFTTTELATISAQKAEEGAKKLKKAVVTTGQKVILYVKQSAPNFIIPAVAYNPPTLTPAEVDQLITILSEPTNSGDDENEITIQTASHGGGGGGGGTITEPVSTSTASTTDTGTSTSTATSTIEITATTTIISSPVSVPTIISAVNVTNTMPTTTILFSGTSTPDFIITQDFDPVSTTTDADGNWSLALENVPTGTTTVNFFAEPDAPHASSTVFNALTNITTITNYIKSAPVTVEVYVSEADAPDITVTDPAECENSLLADACLITTTDVEMSWNSSSAKLDHYTVVINGEAEDTTATSSILALDDNTENTVEIFAVDTEGDTSGSIIYQIIVYSHPVVINEVAWMGTQAYYMDEWMELYNNTPYDIDLLDWKLVTQDGGIDINLQNTITGEGFYLLERTDDTTVNDVTADLIYTGDLNNNGEILILTHASSTIDQTPSDPVYWVAGDNGQRTTMERTDANLPGDMESSWHSNSANARNGRDAHFNPIKGTPRATNSYYEEIIVPM